MNAFAPYRGTPLADERIHGHPVAFCVDATGVNLWASATNGAIVPSDAEVLRLDHASGGQAKPETLAQLSAGMKALYGEPGILRHGWDPIDAGMDNGISFAVFGFTDDLLHPIAGQKNVEHCVKFCAGRVVVDPLRKPFPIYEPWPDSQFVKFAGSAGFQSLAVVEYSHAAKHWEAAIGAGRFSVWKMHAGKWVEGHRGTGKPVVRRCTEPAIEAGLGLAVRLLEGTKATKGYFAKVGGSISTGEVLGA
jgi:hypothetical protein